MLKIDFIQSKRNHSISLNSVHVTCYEAIDLMVEMLLIVGYDIGEIEKSLQNAIQDITPNKESNYGKETN